MKNVFTFIVGGKAGEGIRKAGAVAAKAFTNKRRFVFNMVDYPSLIRGGHNFSVVSTSTQQITSHYMKADLIVVLDERSYRTHRGNLTDNGIIVYNSDECGEIGGIGIPLSTSSSSERTPPAVSSK